MRWPIVGGHELGSNDMKNKMAVKSTFRSSNPSESFQSTPFQFSLEKVCLALQKFHKAQTTNTPPRTADAYRTL